MGRIRAAVILERCAAALAWCCIVGLVCAAEPAPSAGDASAPGAANYAAHCASCHGAQLQGGVHASPLSGGLFDQNWSGKKARMLYSRIISTMPQNDPGTLTVEQALSITLYVFAANGISFAGHPVTNPNDLNSLTIPHHETHQP